MINNLISDPKNKFGLIWSYILKFMNFLIFWDFYEFIYAYFLFRKKLKIFLILRANVAENHQVSTCLHTTWWRMCAYVHSHVGTRVRM